MTDNDDRTPADQLADLLVYIPIGLFFEAPTLLPKLAERVASTAQRPALRSVRSAPGRGRGAAPPAGFEQTTGLLRALGVLPSDDTDRGGDGAG